MRSIYLEGLKLETNTDFNISKDNKKFHHLTNVIRLKNGEKVLLLLGGQSKVFIVKEISKKNIKFSYLNDLYIKDFRKIDLGVGLVKNSALESILRFSVSLGVKKLYILDTLFSQKNIKSLNKERVNNIIVNSMEQSNNPYYLVYDYVLNFIHNMNWKKYDYILCFDNTEDLDTINISDLNCFKKEDKILLLIGPEGGFSIEEKKLLSDFKNVIFVNFNVYILTSPVAVASAVGATLSKFKS